jgi:RNA polymerase sigma factor (sigma-70 family)
VNALLSRIRRAALDPHAADGPLLAAFLEGDNEAFAALVRRYAGLVFGACRRVLRHTQDAEDAFQATFLVLARRAADVWPREAVGAWLFGVAHRVALKARATRAKREARTSALDEAPAPDAPNPDFDLAEAVQRVVAKLPDVYRAAVVACDLEGLSRKCAAERLGWSEGTLSGRLARARQLLAKRLAHLGAAVPALAVALGPVPAARAEAVQHAIDLSAGAAVSAPVLALSQGVVHGMFATKLKLAVAAVLATCALGFGTLSASGNGTEGDGTQPGAKAPGGAPAKPLAPPAKDKPAVPTELLHGSWRVTALTENGKATPTRATDPWVIEIRGATLTMPFQEAGAWKTREYTYKASTEGLVGTIDLIAANKPVGRGIYEFTLPQHTCAKCHSGTVNVPAGLPLGACEPATKALQPGSAYGIRLALAIDGKRPATFGGPGVLVFDMERGGKIDPDKAVALEELLREREKLARLDAERARAAELARERDKLRALAEQLEWLAQQQATAAEAKLLRAELEQAAVLAERAAQQLDVARQQAAVAQDAARAAEAQLARAKAQQAELLAQLDALRKRAEGAKPVPKEVAAVATFTVHVRTLTAAEKVHKVKHTNQTILEAIVYAADDVPVKSDTVSVWIVRGKEVLTVDLPAILKTGETKTNYVIKPGDQVFVQAKPAK